MNKAMRNIATIIGVVVFIVLAVFIGIKLYNDTKEYKRLDIEAQNIKNEMDFLVPTANEKMLEVMSKIKEDVGQNIELADIGSIGNIDIYFVAKVDGEYKYITKVTEEGKEKYKIASNNEEEAKYIVPVERLGLDVCIYTSIDNYNIDKSGNITYTQM